MNIKTIKPEKNISQLFRALSQPTRIQILEAIGEGEACVCHLEAVLGKRQAYISQHLMALRRVKILSTRREGRFIYYRLRDKKVLNLILAAREATGLPINKVEVGENYPITQNCSCPKCEPILVLD